MRTYITVIDTKELVEDFLDFSGGAYELRVCLWDNVTERWEFARITMLDADEPLWINLDSGFGERREDGDQFNVRRFTHFIRQMPEVV